MSKVISNLAAVPAAFREQLAVYESYFNCDPAFDCTNTVQALVDLPCPRVDVDLLVELARFAIKSNFGWPRPVVTLPEFAAVFDRITTHAAARAVVDRSNNDSAETIELQLLGPGSPRRSIFKSRKENGHSLTVRTQRYKSE